MADKEYIKRDAVVELIENAIKKSKTTHGVLVCAHLRTAVMGLRRADVAPRAEVAREIFEELDKKIFNHIPDLHTFEIYTDLKKKYTQPEPPEES